MTATRRGARLALALLLALAGAVAFVPAAPALAAEEEPYVLEIFPTAGTGYGEVTCEYKVGGVKVVEKECEWLEFETKNKVVTLKAVAEKGSEFVDFEGGEGSAAVCNGKTTSSCTVTLEEEYSSIEVRFDEIEPTLDVNVTGGGEVACYVDGLPEFCEGEEFEFESGVLLEPEPEEGWEFASFKNGTGSASPCSGLTEPCSFALEKDSTVEAVFVPATYPLTIAKAGTGQGTVTSEPAGVGCGATCTAKFAEGTEVTLKATAASGSTFSGWSGASCSGTGSCVVVVEEAAVAVTATFTANPKPPGPEEPKETKEGTATAAAVAKVKGGRAKVKLSCSGGLCKGTLKLSAKLRRRSGPVAIGRAPFVLASGESTVLPVKLSAAAQRKLKQSHTLRAKVAGTGVAAAAVKLKLVR